MAGLRRGQRRGTRNAPPACSLPEPRLVERLALAQHVVDGPPQPCRQDRQRLGLAALRLLLLLPPLGPLAAAQEQAGRPVPRRRQAGVRRALLAVGPAA